MAAAVTTGCRGTSGEVMASLKVQRGAFQVIIPAFGELQAAKSTPIVVPPESRFGRQTIGWMAPEYSSVKKDDVVIRLASTELVELLQTEEAALAKIDLEIGTKAKQLGKEKSDLTGEIAVTSIQRKLADIYAARDERIYPRNKIIEDAVDLHYQEIRERHFERKKEQLEGRETAELQLLQSRANTCRVKIGQYRDQLSKLEIRAPHDGILIIDKLWNGEKYRVGMNVWGGQKLGSLPDLSLMEAKLFVLESEASGLKENLAVSLSLDFEPGRVFGGKLVGIDTVAKSLTEESPSKFFETKASLEVTDPMLMKPGVQVKASIFVEKLDGVITVPNQAISFEQGRAFLLVKRSAKVEKRQVEAGARSLTLTVITRGLEEGEEILLGHPKAAE
jgi:multidrug efflux pump subunit AcrA (membrane-fusion protein)